MKSKLLHLSVFFMLTTLLMSCNKEKKDWNSKMLAPMHYAASVDELTIAGKPFVMESIQLNLSDFILTGERLQSDDISIVHLKNQPTDFLNNTISESFGIPIGTYTSLVLETSLVADANPSVRITGKYFFPNGTIYDIDIALDIDKEYNINLNDVDGSSTVFIEKENPKKMHVTLDMEKLFEDINPGLWNAAAVTSNNGSQTIVVDAMNNENVKNALEGKVGESLIIKFQQ